MTTVAIYARYSSDNQRDASIEDQIRLCKARAAKEGWRVLECYTDHSISGASLMRPGIQALLQDAPAGKFEIILTEALDRLSRDQEGTAAIYKRLTFAGVKIISLSEGEISELHVGLKGTMNALYLKDLADKTRRGLRGRVEAGKSGGGNSYGYDVVRKIAADGKLIRGERKINVHQAGVVTRIFNAYAQGKSPRAIAIALNREGIRGPSGKAWGPSTIHGNRQRGTGILNNELYIGRLVWNRLRYVKDPGTGKRVSRLNPESDWIVQDVPELRIIDQSLWDGVKARQDMLESSKFGEKAPGYWDRRRPRYLFSGLTKCGACGAGAVIWNRNYVGCAAARNKGTCENKRTIRRDALEAAVLDGLQHHLMDPALCEVFCHEYAREMNRLRIEHNAELEGAKCELGNIARELDRLVQAIMDGVPGSEVKDRIGQLENRKAELKARLDQAEEMPVLMHPNMGAYYRDQVGALREALNDEERRVEAAGIIRKLIERIELTPVTESGQETLAINLHGHLAGILSLAAKAKAPLDESGAEEICTKLVAGAGFEPATFRL